MSPPLNTSTGAPASATANTAAASAAPRGAPILELLNVESSYGPVQALRGVSLTVMEGKIATVFNHLGDADAFNDIGSDTNDWATCDGAAGVLPSLLRLAHVVYSELNRT